MLIADFLSSLLFCITVVDDWGLKTNYLSAYSLCVCVSVCVCVCVCFSLFVSSLLVSFCFSSSSY